MRITLVAVGRLKAGALFDLFDDYIKRISWPFTLREVEEKRPLSGDELKAREAALLLDALPAGARVVALDERGKALASEDFARQLGRWQDEAVSDLAFVIGGADGLAADVRHRADLVLSLGAMTWPHMLVRVLLAEQLFRAQSILTGHPYHRA